MNGDTTHASSAVRSSVIVEILVSAFGADPLAAWLFPDPARRTGYQEGFYRSLLDHPGAETQLTGTEGAAIWLRLKANETLPGDGPTAGPLARLAAVGAALADRHPVEEPHRYLAVMGVAAGSQGRGIGAAMLRQGLEVADRDGDAVYLEASSARSRDLYLRHRFADLGEPVRVDDAPPLFPMRRPATGSVHK
ncbi:GNAT family N-acetyltransferase [Glycomyces albidus]|uniref:GNAT family N-acetyltransferase n=1 Tax=Glycomyces albidus TaxID=2656774 RepID=A0A6L5G4W1_9ACTN|nr:GNAT family N-acetyltransferase [Glycomyces albidus]MQM24683.1 GNAT family N-acetyltransferase [Glycomyces albidus]